MEEDIKPDATDSEIEESNISEEISDLFEEGETDAVDTAEKPVITLDKIKELTGRDFESVEDFEKHYTNLKSFVGKKQEPVAKTPKEEVNLEALVASTVSKTLERERFVSNPESKDYIDLIESVAQAKGITLTQAWEKHVKPVATDASEYKKGRDVGVSSKTRINPIVSKKTAEMIEAARSGNSQAADDLVNDYLKTAGLR